MTKARPDFKFRFLELEKPFYTYVKDNDISPSKAIRRFIAQGLSGKVGLSIESQRNLLNEVIEIKRTHAGIGRNLNQLARHVHSTGFLDKESLILELNRLAQCQKQITNLLNETLKHLN